MNKELAICVPTYNNLKAISTFCAKEVPILEENNVDLYIFDSSTTEDTKKFIEELNAKGHDIGYARYPSDMPSNVKVYKLFEYISEKPYEYIWMIHDHTVFNVHALVNILSSLKNYPDFLTLDMHNGEYKFCLFKDLDDFLVASAWKLNSFGASIVRNDRFLRGTDWNNISKKYNSKRTLKYSHIGLYFERASQINNFKAAMLTCNRRDFVDFQRSQKATWHNETVKLCYEIWGSVISALPDIYKKKREALHSQDYWYLSKYSMLTYKKEKYYGPVDFIKYYKWMKLMYPKDIANNFLIAFFPYALSDKIINRKLFNKIEQYKESDIYIFGAGRHAKECAEYLINHNIRFHGFIVSSLFGNEQFILNHEVKELKDLSGGRKILMIMGITTEQTANVNLFFNEKDNIEPFLFV